MDTPNLFDSLTPEQLAQLLRGRGLQEEGSLIDQQLAQLLADQPQMIQHSTPLGAGLGSIAYALESGVNAGQAKALRGQRKDNLSAQDRLTMEFAKLLRTPQTPSAPPPMPVPSLPGMDPAELAAFPGFGGASADHSDPNMMPMMDLTTPIADQEIISNPNPPYPTGPEALEVSEQWGLDFSDPKYVQTLLEHDPTQVRPGWGLDLSAPDTGAPMPSLAGLSTQPAPDPGALPPRRGRRPTVFAF